MRVLIVGGGVIGAAIAYFLSGRGAQAVVIERTDVACAASGKSGGFLALDWCDGTPLEPLARRSFALDVRLAEEIGVDWGYRRLDTFGGVVGPGSGRHPDLVWLSDYQHGVWRERREYLPFERLLNLVRARVHHLADGLLRELARLVRLRIHGFAVQVKDHDLKNQASEFPSSSRHEYRCYFVDDVGDGLELATHLRTNLPQLLAHLLKLFPVQSGIA